MLQDLSCRLLAPLAALSILCASPAGAKEPLLAPLSDGRQVELPGLDGSVPTPPQHLGYPVGSRFTHWAAILEYLELLAASSERVHLETYGETYEGRPLVLVAISSPQNIARLETIRQSHLRFADPRTLSASEAETLADSTPVVAWLGYGVHGNESSSAEAAMAAAYVLAAAEGVWEERLERTVVLIDPLVNPDGRERYVHFYESRRGAAPDPEPLAAEHHEPWPGGRQNHYVIDLNRDWAFATQQETRARIAAYRRWEPQVFVDYHEMFVESTYFFSPPTQPIHPQIDSRTLDWLEVFGRANAAAFDRHGWSYFVGENFDLYYPGYGDSYPSLRGAAGMTYEMAGHSRAGSVVRRSDGSILRLADRVARHLTTSLATAGAAADHATELLIQFSAARRESMLQPVTTYLWPREQAEAAEAAALLELHGLELSQLAADARLAARDLVQGSSRSRSFPAGTWAVSTDQPLGALLRALMEPEADMDAGFLAEQRLRVERNLGTDFFDITAWSLPMAFDLDAWAVEGRVRSQSVRPASTAALPATGGWEGVGFLLPPKGVAGYRFVSDVLSEDLRARLATGSFRLGERRYPAGTVFIPREGNSDGASGRVRELAAGYGLILEPAPTSMTDEGITLGSNEMVPLRRARVGLVGGDGVSSSGFGGLWHMLDKTAGLPVHRIDLSALDEIDLDRLDVLVLPEGRYGDRIDDGLAETIGSWVEKGGVLVGIGQAVAWLRERELTSVRSWQAPESEEPVEARDVRASTPADRSLYTPGAALATRLGGPHALLAGIEPPPVLYSGSTVLLPSGDPQKDLVLADPEEPVLAGFAWPEAAQRLRGALLMGVEGTGAGAVVVFAQNPAFRSFWRSTVPLLLNTVLYGPSLNEQGRLAASLQETAAGR